MFPGAGERVPADETTSVFARVRRMRQACRLLCRHFGVMSASGCKPGRPGAGGRPPHHGSAQGEFKNRRKSRSRRGYEAEVFFVPKSASLRPRLPFLNSPSWLLLLYGLATQHASERVSLWRKLKNSARCSSKRRLSCCLL